MRTKYNFDTMFAFGVFTEIQTAIQYKLIFQLKILNELNMYTVSIDNI